MDVTDPAGALQVEWRSSQEGVLSTTPADSAGITVVRQGAVPLGDRWITLRATDSAGWSGADSIHLGVVSFPPDIVLNSPRAGAGFHAGDPVTFDATITDHETRATALTVVWSSDRDGPFNTSGPSANGQVSFVTSMLSRSTHVITVLVTDSDQNVTADSITIHNDLPATVALAPLSKDPSGVLLSWPAVSEPGFTAFRIYRSTSATGPFGLVATLADPATTSYHDRTTLAGTIYWYKVGLAISGGSESTSNVQSITAGISIDVGTQVEAMILDPVRSSVYALDRPNNSLLFISLDSLRVEKTIFVGSSPSDLDIDASGDTLYVANFGSSEIAVVDLANRTKLRSLNVDTGGGWGDGNPYRLVCAYPGRLVWTSYDQWNTLKLINTSTGVQLHEYGSIYYPDLAASSDGSRIYVGESGSSGSNAYRYSIIGDQIQQVDVTPGYGYGYSTRLIVLSGDDRYVFYAHQKFLANNLASVLGTFSEDIYACNHDGSIAVGESKLFDGNTFAILGDLPVSSRIKVMSSDGQILYSYDTTSSRIYLSSLASGAPVAESVRWGPREEIAKRNAGLR